MSHKAQNSPQVKRRQVRRQETGGSTGSQLPNPNSNSNSNGRCNFLEEETRTAWSAWTAAAAWMSAYGGVQPGSLQKVPTHTGQRAAPSGCRPGVLISGTLGDVSVTVGEWTGLAPEAFSLCSVPRSLMNNPEVYIAHEMFQS